MLALSKQKRSKALNEWQAYVAAARAKDKKDAYSAAARYAYHCNKKMPQIYLAIYDKSMDLKERRLYSTKFFPEPWMYYVCIELVYNG
jgi:hypothetical protein